MCVNSYLAKLLVFSLLLLTPATALAVQGAVHDVHRLPKNDEFHNTIEARCTICHTRDRVDQAIGEQADLEELLQQMIEKGAILSERDYNVLGTFWGSPLKGVEKNVPEQQ
jgi:hypothetical protein